MSTPTLAVGLLIMGCAVGAPAAEDGKSRPLAIEDFAALKEIANPRISPDGEWVAFELETVDLKKDESETRLWMVPTAGGESIPMTGEGSSATGARWSPDGRYLAFLSDRQGRSQKTKGAEKKTQVWLLDRRGGEARQLTEVPQGVEALEWAADSGRLVLVIRDPEPEKEEKEKAGESTDDKEVPAPWVIDRLQFKRDYRGYLDRRRTHLFVLDVASRERRQVTFGDYDDSEPAWAPDGQRIAFVSNRSEEPDSNYNSDLWVVDVGAPEGKAEPTRLTSNPGSDSGPVWGGPDGDLLAYKTTTRPEIVDYAQTQLAVIPAAGGDARVLTGDLDRNIDSPRFSRDGSEVLFLLEDHGEVQLAKVPVVGGEVTRVLTGPRVVKTAEVGPTGTVVTLISEPQRPGDLFASGPGDIADLRQLTRVNEELLSGIALAEVEKVSFRSSDGTPIEAFVYRPPGFEKGRRYPTILWPHGGPQAQHDYAFSFRGQLFGANGYVVLMPNPRGSTGYGLDFTLAIWADWGHRDTQDVLAAVDHAIAMGYADPDRLGVGGWSYGGILTNYVITSTDRFAGAVSGASGGLWVANYGHDHYQHWYEAEFGLPWENRELWERLSPYNKVEKITTPTLWIGGEHDWNVPILNSEQMYQAMKRLGRETRLVVYPGEHHGIKRPSYQKHMYEQFVGWFDEHVKGAEATAE